MRPIPLVFSIQILAIFFGQTAAGAFREGHPQVQLQATIQVENQSTIITGSITMQDVNETPTCFYLPYQNLYFPWRLHTFRHFENVNQERRFQDADRNHTTIKTDSKLHYLRSDVVRIWPDKKTSSLSIAFRSRIGRTDSGQSEQTLDGFYPIPLANCPTEQQPRTHHYSRIHHQIDVSPPPNWEVISPASQDKGSFVGPKVSMLLSKTKPQIWFKAGSVTVYVTKQSTKSSSFKKTIQELIPFLERRLSTSPFQRLVIAQTTNESSQSLPGLVVLRPPRQFGLKSIQAHYLNWQHWAIVSLIASQWYGVNISESDPIDRWLVDGINDYITGEFLAQYPRRNNLFNSYNVDFSLLSFNFRQIQDITAALLATRYESGPIVKNGASAVPYFQQNPLLFIRQSIAMRHLKFLMGTTRFSNFLQAVTRHFSRVQITPRSFAAFLQSQTSEDSMLRSRSLHEWFRWWETSQWPDYEIVNWTTQKKAKDLWSSNISLRGNSMFSHDIDVSVHSNQDQLATFLVETNADTPVESNVITEQEPTVVEINPNRDVFEINRFNNSSEGPSIKFFPGSATTLYDSHFTAIWLPYAFKRPGEPFSLGVQSAILQHIQSSMFLDIAMAPQNQNLAYLVNQQNYLKGDGISFGFSLSKNYQGLQISEVKIERRLDSRLFLPVRMGLALRNKRVMGQPNTNHQSIAFPILTKYGRQTTRCSSQLNGEFEYAPDDITGGFEYRRALGAAAGNCFLFSSIQLGARLFRGLIQGRGNIPEQALFRPNDLKEGKLHIDSSELPYVSNITTSNLNLYLPLSWALPTNSTFIVKQGLRLRTFYDFGYSRDADLTMSSHGTGLVLPLGGDVIGAGTLTITKLAALVILRSDVNGKTSRKPTFLFDLSGEL